MPLRDHFRPPVSKRSSWEGFHGQWPAMIVQHLVRGLPDGFVAEPRVHLGIYFEIDVTAFESGDPPAAAWPADRGEGGVATATWTVAEPTLEVDLDLPDQYEYEVLVYDAERDRRLVAALEIVSPANKDRPESRRAFVAKCAALLRQGVSVGVVDLVTVRRFNLYAELLEWVGRPAPALGVDPPAVYTASLRPRTVGDRRRLQSWGYPVGIGQPLPMLPLWLTDTLAVPVDLEASYEDTCRVLRIP